LRGRGYCFGVTDSSSTIAPSASSRPTYNGRCAWAQPWGGLAAGTVGRVAAFYIRPGGDEVAVEFAETALMVPTRVLALVERLSQADDASATA